MTTILIVEDQPLNREFLRTLVEYAGYCVVEAVDGLDALECVRIQLPDLIIVDIVMPRMDGIEFMKRVRAMVGGRTIPAIFYTATYRYQDARQLAANIGCCTVMAKPTHQRDLLNGVREMLGAASPKAISTIAPEAAAEPASKPTATAANSAPPPALARQPSDPGAIVADIQGYLDELSSLQQLQRKALARGHLLISAEGELQRVSDHLLRSLNTLQGLSLRLSALVELGFEISAQRAPDRLCALVCHALRSLLSGRFAVCALYDARTQDWLQFELQSSTPESLQQLQHARAALSGHLQSAMQQRRSLLLVADLGLTDPPLLPSASGECELLVVPVQTPEQCYGALLAADKYGESFSAEDERTAATMALMLAVAYENLLRYEQLNQHAEQLLTEMNQREQTAAALAESEQRFR